jgi:hypothetical protein
VMHERPLQEMVKASLWMDRDELKRKREETGKI